MIRVSQRSRHDTATAAAPVCFLLAFGEVAAEGRHSAARTQRKRPSAYAGTR